MTSEEYDKLTADEKRIKVAELCGWTRIRRGYYDPCGCGHVAVADELMGLSPLLKPNVLEIESTGFGDYPPGSEYPASWQVPDYLSDLNACHEFEKLMKIEEVFLYEHFLQGLSEQEEGTGLLGIWHATAEQRCNAFVLTMTGGE